MDNQQERQLAQARLAMLWDAEGTLGLTVGNDRRRKQGRMKITPICVVSNSNLDLVDWTSNTLHELGVGHNRLSHQPTNSLGKRMQHRVLISGMKRVQTFLNEIADFLIAKKEQGRLIKEYIESRLNSHYYSQFSDHELQLVLECRALNHKGRPWQPESSETTRRIEELRSHILKASSNDIVRSPYESLERAAEMTAPVALEAAQ